jgi:uncharacterized protein (DUF488 family)
MLTIYTIGHSNHEADNFLGLLRQNGVELLVDVRSSPYSRYVPQANRQNLSRTLEAAGVSYIWMGDRLGGKPDGVVADYDALAASPGFQKGISELISLAHNQPTAIMCSEGSHQKCHRYKLITPALEDRDIQVVHIQPDGSLVDEAGIPRQLTLF